MNGIGIVSKDESKAVHYYHLLADQGTALLNESNLVVSKDDIQGIARAQRHLAVCYENGTGVPINLTKAVKYYQLSANQRDPISQCKLGILYETGHGVPQDVVEAVKVLPVSC
jgi:TPR repeat protein